MDSEISSTKSSKREKNVTIYNHSSQHKLVSRLSSFLHGTDLYFAYLLQFHIFHLALQKHGVSSAQMGLGLVPLKAGIAMIQQWDRSSDRRGPATLSSKNGTAMIQTSKTSSIWMGPKTVSLGLRRGSRIAFKIPKVFCIGSCWMKELFVLILTLDQGRL